MTQLSKKRNKLDLDAINLNPNLAEKVAKELIKQMQENPGMTLKEATGVSDEALEEIYCLAYNFYTQGKYRESISLFEFLTGSSPITFKFVLGLAASYHQTHAYNDALLGFGIAQELEPTNPIPAYYATDCFLKQGLMEEALEFAEITAQICEERSEYAALKQRCELIAQNIRLKKSI